MCVHWVVTQWVHPLRTRVRDQWSLWGIANICGLRTGDRRYEAGQLLSGSPDLSLIEAAYLFRNCETYEVIKGTPFSMRKIGGPLENRRR